MNGTLSPSLPPTLPARSEDGDGGRFIPDLCGWFAGPGARPDSLTLVCTPAQYALVAGYTRIFEQCWPEAFDEPDGRTVVALSLAPNRHMARCVASILSPDIMDMDLIESDGTRTRAWLAAGGDA